MASEPTQTEIAELFARDPLLLTRNDVSDIIAQMRSARHTFLKTGRTPSKRAPSKKVAELLALDIELPEVKK